MDTLEKQKILIEKIEGRVKSLENKESSKEGLNKIKAESTKILKETEHYKYKLITDRKEASASFLEAKALFTESKAVSNFYNVMPILNKIYILKEILNPANQGMESLITKNTLNVEGYKEEVESKLMELIRQL